MRTRVLYADVDGTLTGPNGSLLVDEHGAPSRSAVDALIAARESDLDIVLCSGRNRTRLSEVARLLGLHRFLAELGGVAVHGTEITMHPGAYTGDALPADALRPALAAFVQAFSDVESHGSWNEGREITLMARGELDVEAAREWFAASEFSWATLHNNGATRLRPGETSASGYKHIFHIAPRGVSKRESIARDRALHDLARTEVAFVGNSPTDLYVADEVGAVFITHNGAVEHPEITERVSETPNATITQASFGSGFAECVYALLDDSRA
jgi:hydroxymethylpyrimidine pyrophosphatase-like HAD family hydrolase